MGKLLPRRTRGSLQNIPGAGLSVETLNNRPRLSTKRTAPHKVQIDWRVRCQPSASARHITSAARPRWALSGQKGPLVLKLTNAPSHHSELPPG